jgi:hypothetical protein
MEISGRKRRRLRAVPEEEQKARYRYLLTVLPHTVVDRAHVLAFAELSTAQREEMLDRLRPLVRNADRDTATADPEALSEVVRHPEPRDGMLSTALAGTVISHFVLSAPVTAYFATGAGSATIDRQPLWVQELVAHETAPLDAGTMHHRRGVDSGHWIA